MRTNLRQCRQKLTTLGLLIGGLSLAVPGAARPSPASHGQVQHWVSGQALVQLRPGADLMAIEKRSGVSLRKVRNSVLGWALFDIASAELSTPDARGTMLLIATLAADEDVLFAQEDRIYQTLATPNDPGFENMWHLNAIGASSAWDLTTGLTSQRVGVVDTGTLRDHEDLSAKDVAGYDFVSGAQQANDGDGRDADYNDAGDGADCGFGYQDDSFHGSHVAGTIGAATNNNLGIAGLNWNAGIVTARAMGKCGGNLSDIMEGAAWLVGGAIDGVPALAAEDRVSVMNLSLGGGGPCSNFEQQVVEFINEQGAIMVAAAGNDGGAVNSPANCSGVITVAASGSTGGLANYSSFGASVEVVAPGGQIYNSEQQGVLSAVGPGNSDYAWLQGTSMAAPHVTGAISLLQALDPDITFYEIVDLFVATGDSCANCQGKPAMRLDLAATVVETGELPPPPEDDQYAGNNNPASAAALGCGTNEDMFMVAGSEDWFSVDAPQGEIITIDVAASGAFDLDLYVSTDGGATELGRSTSPTGTEQVVISAPGGSVLVSVLSYDGAQGSYSMGVKCEDIDDEFEPNDSVQEAAELSCHSTYELFMAPGDRDWFELDIDPSEPFELSVNTLEAMDLDLYVTTGATFDDVVAESTTPEGNEAVSFTRGDASLYAVVVPFQDATGDYTITLDCPNREPIEQEPEMSPEAEPEMGPDGEITDPEDGVLGPQLRDEDPTWAFGCTATKVSSDVPVGTMLAPAFLLLAAFTRRRRR